MITKKSMLGLGSALVLSLTVAACGSDNNDDRPFDRSGANNSAEPAVAQDAFLDAVTAVIARTSDTTEPESIDAITPTSPSNTAPVPIS